MTMPAAPAGTAPVDERPTREARDYRRLAEVAASAASALIVTLLLFRALLLSGPIGFGIVWYATFVILQMLAIRRVEGPQEAADRLASLLIGTGALIAFVALVSICWTVLAEGSALIVRGFPNFFINDLATVGPLDPSTEAGAFHSIVGTLEQVMIATVFTVPLAIMTAVYLNEIGGRLERPVRFIVDAMSGVPSIVAGFFIYTFFVIRLGRGYSGFAGSLALVVLMMPSVTRTAEEVLKIVNPGLREAALALGAPEWRMIRSVVLPTARSGLVTAAILGVARGAGETAPMLLTSFGSKVKNFSPLNGPQSDLPTFVFDLIKSTQKAQIEEAWAGALVLVALVLALFTLARVVAARGVTGRR